MKTSLKSRELAGGNSQPFPQDGENTQGRGTSQVPAVSAEAVLFATSVASVL